MELELQHQQHLVLLLKVVMVQIQFLLQLHQQAEVVVVQLTHHLKTAVTVDQAVVQVNMVAQEQAVQVIHLQ